MPKNRLSKSIRIYLRREKARMRREFLGSDEAERKIAALTAKTFQERNKRVRVSSVPVLHPEKDI